MQNASFSLGQTAAGYLLQIHAVGSFQSRFQAQSIPQSTDQQRPPQQLWFWRKPGSFLGSGPYTGELASHRLIAGQGGRVPFEWLLHAGYQAFLCATHNKTRISSLQIYVCGPLLELVDSLETNLVIARRV